MTALMSVPTGLYGPEFASQYSGLPMAEAMRFASRVWPVLVLLGFGVYVDTTGHFAIPQEYEAGTDVATWGCGSAGFAQ